jgi:hypothetical protein
MLQNKDILNFGPIGDWFPFEDSMSGTLEWYRTDNDSIRVYATPHWETDGVVPFSLSYDDGEYSNVTTLELNLREPVEYQLNQYISVISTILSTLK